MKRLRFFIPFLVLVLFFGFAPACSETEVEKVEEESAIVEKPKDEVVEESDVDSYFKPPLRLSPEEKEQGYFLHLKQEFGNFLETYGGEGYYGFHSGEDWHIRKKQTERDNIGTNESAGKPVYAIGPGKVEKVSEIGDGSRGMWVLIKHTVDPGERPFIIPAKEIESHGEKGSYGKEKVYKIYSAYGHLDKLAVEDGDKVNENTILGYIKDMNDGSHLHFEIRHPKSEASGTGQLAGDPRYWQRFTSGPNKGKINGYYTDLKKMVEIKDEEEEAGFRCPSDFLEENSKKIDGEYVISVVMVIDVSDSMSCWWAHGVKIESARAAAMELLDLLEAENELEDRRYQVALVEFDTTASLVQPLTSDFSLLRQKVNDLRTLSNTNIGDGLEKAFEELDTANYDRAYVVILSDGMTNTGLTSDEILQWLRKRVGIELWEMEQLQASLFGFDYKKRIFRGEIDLINTIKSTKNAGRLLENAGYKVNVNLNQDTEKALEGLSDDAIFAFSGHGLEGGKGIYFVDEWGYESILCSYNVPENLNMLLTVLNGCETARNLQSDENILKAFIDNGSLVGVGFNEAIYPLASNSWYDSFWHALLVENKTIFEATQAGAVKLELERYGGIDVLRYLWRMDYRVVVTYPIEKAQKLRLADLEEELEQEERIVLSPPVYTVGFGDPGDLDEDLLKSIAHITGGEYFYGAEAFSLANIFIKTQHYGMGVVQAEFEGTIFPGEEVNAGSFILEKSQSELRIALNWPGSLLELKLYDPGGKIIDQNYRGVKIWRTEPPAYLVMEKPQAGEWTVKLYGKDVPEEGSPYYVIVSTGDILIERGATLEFLLVMAFLILIVLIIAPRLFKSRAGRGED